MVVETGSGSFLSDFLKKLLIPLKKPFLVVVSGAIVVVVVGLVGATPKKFASASEYDNP